MIPTSQKNVYTNVSTPESFAAAKSLADSIKAARASELSARGGVPVSASERVDFAQQQSSKYGVGIVPQLRDTSPLTIVDAGGLKTSVGQLEAYQIQSDYFSGKTGVTNPRDYGTVTSSGNTPSAPMIVETTPKQVSSQIGVSDGASSVIAAIEGKDTGYYPTTIETGMTPWTTTSINGETFTPMGGIFNPPAGAKYSATSIGKYAIVAGSSGALLGGKILGDIFTGAGQTWYKASHPRGVPESSSVPIVQLAKWAESKGLQDKGTGGRAEAFYNKMGEKGFTSEQKTFAIASGGAAVSLLPVAGPAILEGLAIYQTGKVGKEWLASPTAQKGGEVLLYGTTAALGAKPAFVEATRPITFWGKTEIPAAKIENPDVAAGLSKYGHVKPGTTASELQSQFYYNKYKISATPSAGFNAAPSPMSGNVIGAGASETPGFYIAPNEVTTFHKLGGESSMELSLFPKASPQAVTTYTETLVGRIPADIRAGGLPAMQEFMTAPKTTIWDTLTGKKPVAPAAGKAYVSPYFEAGLKTEAEAIVGQGSTFSKQWKAMSGTEQVPKGNFWDKLTGFSKYKMEEGQKIPIYEIVVGRNPKPGFELTPVAESSLIKVSTESSKARGGTMGYVSPFDVMKGASIYPKGSSSSYGAMPSSSLVITPSSYGGSKPSSYGSVPSYSAKAPTYSPKAPSYNPKTPTYTPKVPSYTPKTPPYTPKVPPYYPKTPPYTPRTPPYTPKVPPYTPRTPPNTRKIDLDFGFGSSKPSRTRAIVPWKPKYLASITAEFYGIKSRKTPGRRFIAPGISTRPMVVM